MVMENTLRLANEASLKYIFDCKGSTVARHVKGKDLKPTACLKDINFIELSQKEKSGKFLGLNPGDTKKLIKTL